MTTRKRMREYRKELLAEGQVDARAWVSKNIARLLDARCKYESVSRAHIIRRALHQYLTSNPVPSEYSSMNDD